MGNQPPSVGPTQPLVTLTGVVLRLGNGHRFGPIDWQIGSDQRWAVIGPNGSGKSTLMKAISGQAPVARGQILFHGTGNGRKRAGRLQDCIAYVNVGVQEAMVRHLDGFHQARWHSGVGIPEGISVDEYLSLYAVQGLNPYQVYEHKIDAAVFDQRRSKVVELLEIGPLMERNTIQLSSGERRKISIARALLKDPELLILDNPFSGLDAENVTRLRMLIARLMDNGQRVMVVTAQWEDVPTSITHVAYVKEGYIVDQGRWEEMVQRMTCSDKVEDRYKTGPPLGVGPTPAPVRVDSGSAPALVEMQDVCVSYKGTPVLKQIDWTIHHGEHWALLGPNGSGKSTLLSLILGDNPQTYANHICLFGRRRGTGESLWEIKERIGWVAPELHLTYPRGWSCLDVICSGFFDSIGLYRRCASERQATARLWMKQLAIEHLADADLAVLSEGEQRLVLLARAVVKSPDLLVLDEPCQGLDPVNRSRVIETIGVIGRHLDTSIIYVTHQTEALPSLLTHALHLRQGQVWSQGPMEYQEEASHYG